MSEHIHAVIGRLPDRPKTVKCANNKSSKTRPAARASLPLHIHNLLELVQTAPSARGVLASWSALIRLLPGPCQTLY